jgi:A/G-specific adenine glycosylase
VADSEKKDDEKNLFNLRFDFCIFPLFHHSIIPTFLLGITMKSSSPPMVSPALKRSIRTKLLRWFERSARDLPWRRTGDPYAVWISEIMLQQTQVATVVPYFERFMAAFPTVADLAHADLERVLKLWEGLGYYSRARSLHGAAQKIVEEHGGRVPNTLEGLLSLPGVGRYTAGAILSIAFHQAAPILDGNVKRVLSRLFAISLDPAARETEELLWSLSASLVPTGKANPFNQGLMELGAMICTPRDPGCLVCPLRNLCIAGKTGDPEAFPVRREKKKIPRVERVAAVIQRKEEILVRQRPAKGLLGGLWEFPGWEAAPGADSKALLQDRVRKEIGIAVRVGPSLGTFDHTYSHFHEILHVFPCRAPAKAEAKAGRWVLLEELHRLPMSRLHRRIADLLQEKT